MFDHRAVRSVLFAAAVLLAVVGCEAAEEGATPGATPPTSAASPGPSAASAAPAASPATPAASPATGGGGGSGVTGGVAGTTVSIPDLVDAVRPSVVAILRDDGGEGSGVIWSADGVIVTNNHVIAGTNTVEVVYADGSRDEGVVEAADPRSDLAVVRVERTDLPAATFRDDLPRVGELAIAIGNPLGFEESVTAGIISGLGRSVPGTAATTSALVDLIQTDAPISPGNSGGALVGADGRIIGINVAYIPPEGGAVSIGFSIPAPTAASVVQQLLETGRVEHAYLGIQQATLDRQTAAAYELMVDAGAVVLTVVEGSPADEAGILPGDIIVGIGEDQITSAEDVLAALRRHRVGDQVEVRIVREGAETAVTVTLGDLPD